MHTPGPWRVTSFGDQLGVASSASGERIGMIWTQTTGLSLGDARLIAAAPDLLDAVKAYRDPRTPRNVADRLADAAFAKIEGTTDEV